MRHLNFNNLNGQIRWIVSSSNHCSPTFLGLNWAVFPCAILSLTPLPISVWRRADTFSKFRNNTSIYWICSTDTLENSAYVVVSGVLFTCSSDSIMMLNNSDNIHHNCFSFKHLFNLLISGLLIN